MVAWKSPGIEVGPRLEGNPKVVGGARIDAKRTRSGDADDGERDTTDVERLPWSSGIAGERGGPESVADDGSGSVVLLVGGGEADSGGYGNAEAGEELPLTSSPGAVVGVLP